MPHLRTGKERYSRESFEGDRHRRSQIIRPSGAKGHQPDAGVSEELFLSKIQKQLSVFLENRPGLLAKACSILSDAGVNILALAIHDTVDNAVVRFLVDQPTKALLLLEEEELYVMEQEVLVLEILNRAGELTRICRTLAEADINIAYAYCTARPDQHSGCLVLKTDNPERALEVLTH